MSRRPQWKPCNDADEACRLEQVNATLTAKQALDRNAARIEDTPRGTPGEKPTDWKRG
jgi:hypothetical protein